MNSLTVLDMLDIFEYTLQECDINGRYPNDSSFKIITIWKYSLLYLVYTQKLDLSDSESDWNKYMKQYRISDHYAVANAYLRNNGMYELDYKEAVFKNRN